MNHGDTESTEALLVVMSCLLACAGRTAPTRTDAGPETQWEADARDADDVPPAPPSSPDSGAEEDEGGEAVDGPRAPRLVVEADGESVKVRAAEGTETAIGIGWARTFGGEATGGILAGWVREGDGWKTTNDDQATRWTVVVGTDPARPALKVRVDVEYLRPAEVRHEELVLRIPAAREAIVLGRDMAERPLREGEKALTDTWTPLEVRASSPGGRLTIVRTAGFPSAVSEADESGLTVRLELDDAGNHPYRPYRRCFARYSPGNARDELDGTPRGEGDRAEHAAEIVFGDFAPLRLQRLPAGRRAAIVFTSHADQSTTATTKALLWGSSDVSDPAYGSRGVLGHGLAMTLAAFAESGTRDDLGDAPFRAILEAAAAAGVEVCPHSVTARSDDRETVTRLLQSYSQFGAATWIDHQPDTNCEAVMNAGGVAGRDAKFFDIDLLHGAGLRYVWSEPDVELEGGGLNMLEPGAAAYRPTIFFRNANVRDGAWVPWMFRTLWMFVERRRLLDRLDKASVDRLIAENGVLLAHAYMDAYQANGRLANRSLVEREGDGFRVRDDVDALFERLGELQRDGVLWVPSMRAFGDHLATVAGLRVEYAPDGSMTVAGVELDADDVTFSVPVADAAITVDGNPPNGVLRRDGRTIFWFDVPRGSTRTIRVERRRGTRAGTAGRKPILLVVAGTRARGRGRL